MATVDLTALTRGEVRMLTGHQRGVAGRELFRLDELDRGDDVVVIVAPPNLDAVSPSFVQGFLAASIRYLGRAKFKDHFDLSHLDDVLREDFLAGIERLELHARGS